MDRWGKKVGYRRRLRACTYLVIAFRLQNRMPSHFHRSIIGHVTLPTTPVCYDGST